MLLFWRLFCLADCRQKRQGAHHHFWQVCGGCGGQAQVPWHPRGQGILHHLWRHLLPLTRPWQNASRGGVLHCSGVRGFSRCPGIRCHCHGAWSFSWIKYTFLVICLYYACSLSFLHLFIYFCFQVRSIFLRGFDQQMANKIGDYMGRHGVKFIKGAVPTQVEQVSAWRIQLYI